MKLYKHLLAAVDFQNDNDLLIERVKALREVFDARLSLVHVVEYVPMAYSGDLALPDDFNLEQELADLAQQRMQVLGERMDVRQADQYILAGSTAKEILRIVKDQGVDLILVGSHGRHGLSLLLGSTPNAILHHAPCDVLAVRIEDA